MTSTEPPRILGRFRAGAYDLIVTRLLATDGKVYWLVDSLRPDGTIGAPLFQGTRKETTAYLQGKVGGMISATKIALDRAQLFEGLKAPNHSDAMAESVRRLQASIVEGAKVIAEGRFDR